MRASARLAGRLVAVSASDAADITALLGVPAADITVIPNGVNPGRFAPAPLTAGERLSLLRRWLVDDPKGWQPGGQPGSLRYTPADLDRIALPCGGLRPVLL